MLILRPYTQDDWPVLARYQYPSMTETEINNLIAEFNSGSYKGRRLQMLAVENNGTVVGYVSLYEQDSKSASEGVEIYPPYRRRGFAYAALRQLFARTQTYRTITAQVRKDNVASLALHNKLGFRVVDESINRRGHAVYSLSLSLLQEIATSLRSSQ